MKALVVVLVAAVVGLGVALAVVAADSGDDETTGSSASSSSSTTTTTPSTTTSTATPTTSSTTASSTTTSSTATTSTTSSVATSTTTNPARSLRAAAARSGPVAGPPGAWQTCAPMSDAAAPRIASYQADPAQVGRVLLLYSGGLDTSVLVHWIRERYGAEIVTLTVDLGQPGENWDVIVGKARSLGAIDVDSRRRPRAVRAATTCCRAIKANALYGGGYPLFTALARPLIGELAVEYARAATAATRSPTDARARATTRFASTARSPPSIPGSRCWPRCASGAWAARRRSPTRASTGSRSRAATSVHRRTRSTTTSGVAPRRDGTIEDLARADARRRLPPRHPAGGGARRAAADQGRLRARLPGLDRRRAA